MKLLFFSLLLFISVFCKSQTKVAITWASVKPSAASDTIYYAPSQKLIWKDFKSTPKPNNNIIAITSSGFGYSAGAKSRNGKTDISISVYCFFSKKKSWVVKGKESDYALNHEQHHFDVSYIIANNFIEKLKAAKFTWDNYNELLDKIYAESMMELEKMQNKYDSQTHNGRNTAQQKEWNKYINDMLKTTTTN